jgi:hypothetical protein
MIHCSYKLPLIVYRESFVSLIYTEDFEILTGVVIKTTIFWDIVLCCWLKFEERFGRIFLLSLQSRISRVKYQRESSLQPVLLWYLARLFSKLRIETICSSETSVGFLGTTRHYIPKDGTLHILKFYFWHIWPCSPL